MPLLAIAKSLRDRSDKAVLLWLGQGDPEESAAAQNQIPFCKIACAKFRRYFSFWNFTDIFKMPIGIFQSFFLILGFRPDAIFSKGGYVSLPVIFAAFLLRKKIIVHESDVITGLSNRIAARFAKKVLLGFPDRFVKNKKYIFMGNPVRKEILRGAREKAFQFFSLQKDKPVILAMGGSQGSRFINNLIVKALPKLEKYQIIHLTGGNIASLLHGFIVGEKDNFVESKKYYHSYSYLDVEKMALAYSVSDLVISRAGANSLAEIAVCNKPSILIPLPASASGHQMANAKVFAKAGASLILEQKDLNAEKFSQEVKKLLTDLGRLAKMASQAKSLAKLDAAEKIAGEIMSSKFNQFIHFIGIGGIGISGLAKIYLEQGHKISGSDLVYSDITQDLEKRGAKIKIGEHKKENLAKDADRVIYNLAIAEDNPELQEARRRGIACQTYPQALGELTKKHFTIAVSGTHGKTTTTGMIALMLLQNGFDPTVIIGSKLKELGNSNSRLGKSKYLVIEADEYKRAFLNYHPDIAVITNIEKDHLDYYKDLRDVQNAFSKFADLLPKDGVLIVNKNIVSLFHGFIVGGRRIINYGKESCQKLKKILKVPGKHNIQNALAAFAVGKALGAKQEKILVSLASYRGAWRRFEIKYDKRVTVIDDYGHHPTEIAATLSAAREKYPDRRIWCIFQPHQIARTEKLFVGFTKAFSDADKIIITRIFGVAGRDSVNQQARVLPSQRIVESLKKQKINAVFLETFDEITDYLLRETQKGDVILVMGAGDINALTPLLIKKLKNRENPPNPPYQGGHQTPSLIREGRGGLLKNNESLSRHTQFQIGGPARFFCVARTSVEIAQAALFAKSKKLPFFILGKGTNTLVSDNGFPGLVIENNTKGIEKQGREIICASGEKLSFLVNFALKNKLAGLESLFGIPGTVGGAIFGNAGAFGASASDHLLWVKFYDPAKNKIVKFTKKQCAFSYRESIFKKNQGIILEAGFGLAPDRDSRAIQEKVAKIKAVRSRHPYQNCAGSVFKNILMKDRQSLNASKAPAACRQRDEIKVACLIENLGLKGKTIGGAQISGKHANFIVNKKNAKARDVLALIAFAQEKVYKEYGIVLETEIQMVGFK